MGVPSVEKEALQLMREYPAYFFTTGGKLDQSWDQSDEQYGLPSNLLDFLVDMVMDTHSHIEFVYREYLNGSHPSNEFAPSAEYVKQVQRISKEQVALGGYRLASWLNYHAKYLPRDPCG